MRLYPGNLAAWGESPNQWNEFLYPRPFGIVHAFGANMTARATFDAFMDPEASASTTGIVGKAGDLYQLMDPCASHWGNCCPTNTSIAWPAGNANRWSWAVEFEKHTSDNSEPLTDAQKAAGFPFLVWLARVNGTPLVPVSDGRGGICSHSFLDPVHRPGDHDPGPFPWEEFWSYAKEHNMIVLPNFPLLSQRTTLTTDKQASENAPWNCVYASIGMGIQWYRGKTEWDDQVNPDYIKDEVQGQGYVGGGAASLAVPFCERFGLHLYEIKGSNSFLVSEMHRLLRSSTPSILTIISIYDPRWWHVHIVRGETADGLEVVDPYPYPNGALVRKSDREWINELQTGSIWALEGKGVSMGLPPGAKDTGTAITFAGSPHVIVKGYRTLYNQLAASNLVPPDDLPMVNEYGANPVEFSNPSYWGGPGTAQETRYFRLGWSPKQGVRRTFFGQEFRWYVEALGKATASRDAALTEVKALQAKVAEYEAGGVPIPEQVKADLADLAEQLKPVKASFAKLVTDSGLVLPS